MQKVLILSTDIDFTKKKKKRYSYLQNYLKKETTMVNAVESKIAEGINSALTSVINSREEYYENNPLPSVSDV